MVFSHDNLPFDSILSLVFQPSSEMHSELLSLLNFLAFWNIPINWCQKAKHSWNDMVFEHQLLINKYETIDIWWIISDRIYSSFFTVYLLFFLKTKKLDWLIRSFLANCPNIIFQKTFLDEYHLLLHRKFLAKQLRLPTFSLDYYTWKSFCCGVSSKDFWSFPRKKDDSMLTVATDVVDVDIGVSRGNPS